MHTDSAGQWYINCQCLYCLSRSSLLKLRQLKIYFKLCSSCADKKDFETMLCHFMLGLFVYLGSSLTRYVLCECALYSASALFFFRESIPLSFVPWYFGYILLFIIYSLLLLLLLFWFVCVYVNDFVFAIVSNHARDTAITLSIAICDSASCFWCTCTHIYYIILYISMSICVHEPVQI